MMKKISEMLIILLILSSSVTALQDSYIKINSNQINLCLSDYNSMIDYKCNGEALQLEGTQDHVIYIMPYTDLPKNNTNYNSTIMYYFDKPIIWVGLFSTGFLIPVMFLSVILIIMVLLLNWVIPKR